MMRSESTLDWSQSNNISCNFFTTHITASNRPIKSSHKSLIIVTSDDYHEKRAVMCKKTVHISKANVSSVSHTGRTRCEAAPDCCIVGLVCCSTSLMRQSTSGADGCANVSEMFR